MRLGDSRGTLRTNLNGTDAGLEHVQDVLGHLVGNLLATPRQYLGLLKTLRDENNGGALIGSLSAADPFIVEWRRHLHLELVSGAL